MVPWRDAVRVLELGRLDPGASTTLVDNLCKREGPRRRQRTSIVKQAEGIPLFIEELTRSCLDEDRTDAMPFRLQELFTWRLKAPRVDLRVVQAAATIGPAFDADTVAAVVGDQHIVDEQLAVLTAEGVIEPGDQAARAYRFRHALMRDAAYETQVLDVRRLTHARVAEALGARRAEPALIAKHLDLAGQVEAAAAQYLVAGQAEQGRGAHVEATRLLSRAIALVEPIPESADRDLRELTARMLRAASVSAMSGYAAPAVQEDHRRAEQLTARLGARPEVLPSLIAIWAYWLVHGGVATTRALIERLAGMVHEDVYSWFTPEVEACVGWQQFYEADFEAARAHFEISMTGFRARPPDQTVSPFWPLPNDPIAVSLIALSCLSTARGDLVEAEQWEVEAIRRAEQIGFPRGPFSLAFVKTFAAWNARSFGDDEKSRRLGEEVVALGREHGYALWTALGSAYAPPVPTGGAEHRAFLEQVITTVRLMGQESFMAAYLGYLAELHAGRLRCLVPWSALARPCRWWRRRGRTSTSPSCSATGLGTLSPPARTPSWRSPTCGRRCASRGTREPGSPACEPPWSSLAYHWTRDRTTGAPCWRRREVISRRHSPPATPPLPMSSSPTDPGRPRVVILGGGMAGLVTAWELSSGDWTRAAGLHHGLPTGVATGGQGREQPRPPRTHRGARPPRPARLLRRDVSRPARGLRRARSTDDRPDLPHPHVAGRRGPCRRCRPRRQGRRRLDTLRDEVLRATPTSPASPVRRTDRSPHSMSPRGRCGCCSTSIVPGSFPGLAAASSSVLLRRHPHRRPTSGPSFGAPA